MKSSAVEHLNQIVTMTTYQASGCELNKTTEVGSLTKDSTTLPQRVSRCIAVRANIKSSTLNEVKFEFQLLGFLYVY